MIGSPFQHPLLFCSELESKAATQAFFVPLKPFPRVEEKVRLKAGRLEVSMALPRPSTVSAVVTVAVLPVARVIEHGVPPRTVMQILNPLQCKVKNYYFFFSSNLCGLWFGHVLSEQRSGIVFGHEYFLCRNTKNFSTPTHPFFLLEKHDSVRQRPHASKAVCLLPER